MRYNLSTSTNENSAMSLLELNSLIRELIETQFYDCYWVKAELSEVRVSSKGHCFLELIQKAPDRTKLLAKARAVIMADLFPLLQLDFEAQTGQHFQAGLEVMLLIRPTFNEVYGYSLIVEEIDASYTLGDMVRRRKEILEQLAHEGVIDMQKELTLPIPIERIAIISSPTAAGYEDFCHHIESHAGNFRFKMQLFPAMMQGDETESSIIEALDKIASEEEAWDVVVIIRGGGAVSDLNSFETYNLAFHCAQFPLPIITGIGHQRDMTVIDHVAHTHLKTPTAVGDCILTQRQQVANTLEELTHRLEKATGCYLEEQREKLTLLGSRFEWFALNFRKSNEQKIDNYFTIIEQQIYKIIALEKIEYQYKEQHLQNLTDNIFNQCRHFIELTEEKIRLSDPKRILEMGYSITLFNGHAISNPADLKTGDELETRFKEGTIKSIVK